MTEQTSPACAQGDNAVGSCYLERGHAGDHLYLAPPLAVPQTPGDHASLDAALQARFVQAKADEPIMQFFDFTHLPHDRRWVSRLYARLALETLQLPRCAERSVALRKLLEAKDAAMRAWLTALYPAPTQSKE